MKNLIPFIMRIIVFHTLDKENDNKSEKNCGLDCRLIWIVISLEIRERLTIFFAKNGIRKQISNTGRDSFCVNIDKNTPKKSYIYLSVADQLLLKYQC